jgi:hypothetical protein
MIPIPEFGHYPTPLGDEPFLRFNSQSQLQLIIIEPFFEERNFLRNVIVAMARRVAERGIGTMIPDLPGCGESSRSINDIRLGDWRDAVAGTGSWLRQAKGCSVHVAAFRGGALLDDAVVGDSWWRFAPVTGSDLLRPMRRASMISGQEISSSGYDLHSDLINDIESAQFTKPAGPLLECAVEQQGAPLWRRAEPDSDPWLAEALAQDLIAWVNRCARD